MGTLTRRELQSLDDLLSREEVMVRKYVTLSTLLVDPQLRTKFVQASARHQDHIHRLLSYLSG